MFLKLFFLFLLLAGLALAAFGLYFIAWGNEARNWPETAGTILSVTVRTDSRSTGNAALTAEQRERRRRYYPSITYRWEIDGAPYTGSRYRLGTTHEKFKTREQATAAAAAFRNGAPIRVYYDPANPSEAVLNRDTSGGVFVPLPIGLLFAAVGWLGLRKVDVIRKAMASGAGEPLDLG